MKFDVGVLYKNSIQQAWFSWKLAQWHSDPHTLLQGVNKFSWKLAQWPSDPHNLLQGINNFSWKLFQWPSNPHTLLQRLNKFSWKLAQWPSDPRTLLQGVNKFLLLLFTYPGRFQPISEWKVFTKCCSVKLGFVKIGRTKIFSFRFYTKLPPMPGIFRQIRIQFSETDVHKILWVHL